MSKISCRNLWKVFGPEPDRIVRQSGSGAFPGKFDEAGHVVAVRDVSFDVKAGEILVIMGLSGSGKSTLIRCLSRLVEPTAGTVELDGENLLAAPTQRLIELRRYKMGMVFQHFGLLPHRNVLDNVSFPLEVQGAPRPARERRAMEMIRLVGLEGRESYFPRELSGGQQQRVGIARSLAIEPDIWFLDEPFSALDPLIRREMQDEFLRLQGILRKTIIFITHDFDEATRLADRIGIMKDGRLIQLSTAEEMITHPANDYVAAFAKYAPRERIITAGAVMVPPPPGFQGGASVPATAKLREVAARVFGSEQPVPVVDGSGAPVGVLTRERVIATLYPN